MTPNRRRKRLPGILGACRRSVLVGAALVGVLVIDAAYWRKSLMPRWFLPLRITLSLVAAISLFAAGAALSFTH